MKLDMERQQTEKFEDLSPTQLTVSNPSQSSVDSVSLFICDLSQAVRVLDSVMECAVVWVQCMYILALPLDIDSVDQCHNLYNTCSDLKLAKKSVINAVCNQLNSAHQAWCSVQVVQSSVNLISRLQ